MDERRMLELVRRQYGMISRAQARSCGMSDRQIGERVRRGVWRRVRPGVYRHEAVPTQWTGLLLGACWALNALASHRSAAALHKIDGYRPGPFELVVARGRSRPAVGVTLHESTQMHLAEPTERGHVPCTGLARTVLDLAAVVGRKRLEHTIDAVIRDRQLVWTDLYSVLIRHARRGRDGSGKLRSVLNERYGEERVPLSVWSRMVSDLMQAAGVAPPKMEHRISDGAGRFVAQVDLAYPRERLAIELDSVRWHLNHESFRRDPRRRNRLILAGWTVLNFTWQDFADEPYTLCATVRAALAALRSSIGPASQIAANSAPQRYTTRYKLA